MAAAGEQAVATSNVDGVPINMPVEDLTITAAAIIKWNKNIVDGVKVGEAVVEVETDKATVDIEAPAEAVVAMGQQIGTIKVS